MRNWNEGSAWLQHLRVEHNHLEGQLRELSRILDGCRVDDSSCDWRECVRQPLDELIESVEQHFREEESGGCLEEAACRVPRLSNKVAAIEHEHSSLLDGLNSLAEDLHHCAFDEFRQMFERLATELLLHESAENEVMNEAFGTNFLQEVAPEEVNQLTKNEDQPW